MRLSANVWYLAALAALATACSPTAGSPGREPVEGDEAFFSAAVARGSRESLDDSPPQAGEDDSGGERTVEEGDVYKLSGDTLYVVNAYRGLQIIDVSDPDSPVLLGTSPIFGRPVEMYLRDGYAYVIVSDYFSYWQVADGPTRSFHGSQVRVVDVRVPDQPVIVGGIDVEGAVSDTRIVGDVLYVVSNRYAWYDASGSSDFKSELFVASIDLADPSSPQLVQRLDFPSTSNHIHVSPTTLYVASPTGDWRNQATTVTIVDIDDPHGAIEATGQLSVQGFVEDRSQLDEYAGTFRIVTHWGGWGVNGTQRLTVFSLTDGVTKLSELDLPNTGGLFATRFDGERAYLVTMVSVDPLEVIDLRDPASPVLTHSLVIPGVLHHVVARGDRLLALGTDDIWSGVAASLFDVADPRAPVLLSRVQVGQGSAWSNANWDDKALKVLDDDGMMLVPFSAWSSNASGGRYVNGFQIIDFDRQKLTARGIVEQQGMVSRVTSHEGRLLSLSDRTIQSIDATDRDRPRIVGTLELARDVLDFAVVDGRAVTLSTSGWYWEAQETELRIAPLSAPEGEPLGRLSLPFHASRIVADGSRAIVLGWPRQWDGTARAALVDIADPASPKLLRSTSVGMSNRSGAYESVYLEQALRVAPGVVALPAYSTRMIRDQWESRSGLVVADIERERWSFTPIDGYQSGELLLVGDEIWTSHQEFQAVESGGRAYSRFYLDRIDVSRRDAPGRVTKVNVPGSLVGVADGGRVLFTRDYQWNAEGYETHALAELTLHDDRARLRRYVRVDEGLGRIVVQGRRLYASTQPWWWARASDASRQVTLRTWASSDEAPLAEVSRQVIDGNLQLREAVGGHLFLGSGYWNLPWDCGFVGDVAWSWGGPSGVVAYSLADPDRPAYRQFVRTNGWVQGLAVVDGTLHLSTGIYGMQAVPLWP